MSSSHTKVTLVESKCTGLFDSGASYTKLRKNTTK